MQIFLIKHPVQKSSTDVAPEFMFKVELEGATYVVILQPDKRRVDVHIIRDIPNGTAIREFWPVGLHDLYAVAINAVNAVHARE